MKTTANAALLQKLCRQRHQLQKFPLILPGQRSDRAAHDCCCPMWPPTGNSHGRKGHFEVIATQGRRVEIELYFDLLETMNSQADRAKGRGSVEPIIRQNFRKKWID